MTTNTLLTLDELATELRVSKGQASKLLRGHVRGTKPLPVVRIGRRVLVRREDLFEWISQSSSSSVVR